MEIFGQILFRPIREWAKRRSNEIGPLHVADMESTTFFDLNLRLGQPYLYVHQGACEHLMVFCDLRLMNAADKQDMSLYPISILHKFQMRTVCCVCKIYTAK
jgi:snRNA-activating protein complex subunit 3